MFHQKERTERVDFKSLKGVRIRNLRWGFFGVEDARDAEGEMKVG